MAYGICDVPRCGRETYMGWRPVTAPRGRQVCKHHWGEHRNKNSEFSLYDAFGFDRPVVLPKTKVETPPLVRRCACGRELQPRCRFCQECARQRERERKAEYQHQRRQVARESTTANAPLEKRPRCKHCGKPREKGHVYCTRCAEQKQRESKRKRQTQWRQKRLSGVGTSVSEKSRFLGPQTAKIE